MNHAHTGSPPPWYYRPEVVIVALVIFWPVGVLLTVKTPAWPKLTKFAIGVGGTLGALIVLALITPKVAEVKAEITKAADKYADEAKARDKAHEARLKAEDAKNQADVAKIEVEMAKDDAKYKAQNAKLDAKIAEDEAEAKKAEAEAAKGEQISALELDMAYHANGIAADARFKKKRIRVNGTIDTISTDILNHPYVTLRTDEYQSNVECCFSDEHKGELSQKAKGSAITIGGTCEGQNMMSIVLLGDCSVE